MEKSRNVSLRGALALVALALALAVPAALAQEESEPCFPDCPFTPWGPESIEGVTLPDGCVVTVSFNYRDACGAQPQVSINWIQPYVGNPSPACDYLKTGPIHGVLDAVTLQLFKDNPSGEIPPFTVTCKNVYRVVKGSCWSRLEPPGLPVPVTILSPCSETACCRRRFRVCLQSNGVRTATKEPPFIDYPQDCPSVPPINGGSCQPVCLNE